MDRRYYASFPPFFYYDDEPEYDSRIPGSMQRPSAFSSVMHGMKFIQGAQVSLQSPDDEIKKISSIRSVLDLKNRRALAKQGFYGKEYMFKESVDEAVSASGNDLSASQKRKKFHLSGKSRNWSFTDDPDNQDSQNTDESNSGESFDEGLQLRSFSDRYSSDSSLESVDSFGEERRRMIRQSSISNFRKQYQETIRQSMDGDLDVFEDLDDNSDSDSENKKTSIGEVRKKQVDRLMLSIEDDGDYFAHSRQSSLKEVEPALKRAQNSTQSTLTASPITPKDNNFSFDKTLKDGQSDFDFSSPSSPKKSQISNKKLLDNQPAVSIVVEDESEDNSKSVELVQSNTNPNELTALSLVARSDSCNTLVPQDSCNDVDHLDGDLTPRNGDVSPGVMYQSPDFSENDLVHVDSLSESTSSLETLNTVCPADQDFNDNIILPKHKDFINTDEEWRSKEMRSRSQDHLRPKMVCPPQESFELEEISSVNGSSNKSQPRRGHMEKWASTHSDSSGFADVDPVGETSQGVMDLPKENLTYEHARPSLTKQKTFDSNRSSTINENQTSLFQQTENFERHLDVNNEITVNNNHHGMTSAKVNHKALYVCRKDSEENISEKENTNPSLTRISYVTDERLCTDKAVVYTVNIPLIFEEETQKIVPSRNSERRYVSTVRMKVTPTNDDWNSGHSEHDQSEHSYSMQIGKVKHREIKSDLDPELCIDLSNIDDDLDRNEVYSHLNNRTYQKNNLQLTAENQRDHMDFEKQLPSNHGIPRNATDVNVVPNSELHKTLGAGTKGDIVQRKRSKEALIAANNQTADWLLSNERHNLQGSRNKPKFVQKKARKPVWASTPDLKSRHHYSVNESQMRPSYKDGSHSLEMLSDDEDSEVSFYPNKEYFNREQANAKYDPTREVNGKNYEHLHRDSADRNYSRRHIEELRQHSACSSMDESIPIQKSGLRGSSQWVATDSMQYLKLMRLVNGPSSILSPSTKMPIVRFTPNFHSKNWMELPKQKHLEEETRLIQHAVQRYKAELTVMETSLFTLYQTALPELSAEERADVEELQHLWSEVRKEVSKMEELLSVRLSSVLSGKDGYDPLDAMEIIQAMITLLREQLYHQQMCIIKDISFCEDDNDDLVSEVSGSRSSSVRSVSSSGPWWSDLSQQMWDVKHSVAQSQETQKRELRQSLSELRGELLSEVKSELSMAQNTKTMELQLQVQENQIRRLKMELLLQSVESGGTRRRQLFESDV